MAAYLIADTAIENAEAYEAYKTQAKALAERFGGVYRARGGALQVDDADLWRPTRLVIIEFPDMASAHAYLASPDYAPAKQLRRDSARSTVVVVEGLR
ncbi:DUF1330 domain-containing protein [Rubrimonas cliftonensis]|uniref:Uncharacterized conserved protein, DUF1330 family n=1 Tax=Rubrimonas cliftonensis TaxID=89524 RepID=A0A1H4ASK1_9RHOB|nr:DUF1330 domain-containing protein [Rubrimonas cliftonensis]SEA38778.1 Uncharacterized conserved protein, DUF1330 family [Rubrimonas cliftonensis]